MPQTIKRPKFVLLLSVVLAAIGPRSFAADIDPDEKALREAKVGTDGRSLLDFLRSRTLGDEDGKKIEALVKQLGSRSFKQREKAMEALIRYGRLALPYLRQGSAGTDAEIVLRSRRCIEAITTDAGAALSLAVLRVIGSRKPDGAVDVVLRYLPFADDSSVVEEAFEMLAAISVRDGKADPAAVKALGDEAPLKRAAAARALGRAKEAKVRAPVRKLLSDPVPSVRLEAARALLLAKEKEAVPALIELLRVDALEITGSAESLLFLVAVDKAPEASAGDGSAAARKKWHETWVAWWKANGDRLDLAKINTESQLLGLVMVAETADGRQVREYGRDRKERWKITSGFSWPMDVRMLPGGNILVADSSEGGVTEHDRTGKVVWSKKATPGDGGALAAQRLPNGHTFICEHRSLLEVDRSGKPIVTHAPGGETITDAVRLRNGNVVFMDVRGVLREITWPGRKEVRTLRLCNAGPQGTDWYRIEPTPSGGFLLASHTDGRVFEIDATGKVIWEHKLVQAYSATRLANGNVLIATAESKRLVEVDRAGKIVYESKTQGYLGRVRAR